MVRQQWLLVSALTLFAISAAIPAHADDDDEDLQPDPPSVQQLKPRVVSGRRLDSYGNYVISRGEGKANGTAARKFELHFGASAGVSTASATDADPGVSNLALNATLDARAWKYVGAEADVHGDLLSAKYYGNSTGSTTTPTSKVSRDYLFAGKFQYPFWWGQARVIPKIGGGYGYMATSYVNPLSGPAAGATATGSTAAASATTTAQNSQLTEVSGFFGLLGVDVEVTRELVFFADYARAFSAQGVVTVNDAADSASALNNCGFNRIRVGGYYRLGQNWGLGGQFVRRSATFDAIGGGTGQADNTQMQFLGMVLFEL